MNENIIDTIGFVQQADPEVGDAMAKELARQKRNLELIASENIVSPAVMAAMGSVLTNKYAEGYPGKRYYCGCEDGDIVETIAIERAKKLFGAKYAIVQAHSGAQANTAVYVALLTPGDTVMCMCLAHGGHLTVRNFHRRDLRLLDVEIRCVLQRLLHVGVVFHAGALYSQAVYGRTLSPVENTRLNERSVRRTPHLAAQGVYLAHDLTFCRASDTGITRHISNAVQ